MQTSLVQVLAVILVFAADKKDPSKKTDQNKLQGTWVVVSAETEGMSIKEIKGNRVVISGNTITHKFGSEEKKGSFKLNPSKNPKQIDFTEGEDVYHGIYKLDDDSLKFCLPADPSPKRPTEFTSKKGSGTILMELKRQKK